MKRSATLTVKLSLRPRARTVRKQPTPRPIRQAVSLPPRCETMVFLEWLAATGLPI